MDIKPQNVLDYHGNNAIFMVWNFKKDLDFKDAFKRICKLVINLDNSAYVRFPDSGASCVMGIGYNPWIDLHLPIPIPKELENFAPIVGEKHTAVSTKGDLHFHIRGDSSSVCYDLAHAVSDVLEPVAISIEEIHGFRYWVVVVFLVLLMVPKIPKDKNGHSLAWSVTMILSIKAEVTFLFKNIFMI
jgi:porphyrinogen peroxidase